MSHLVARLASGRSFEDFAFAAGGSSSAVQRVASIYMICTLAKQGV